MEEKEFLNTHEVAKFLDINEKMVYSIISEKGLPTITVYRQMAVSQRQQRHSASFTLTKNRSQISATYGGNLTYFANSISPSFAGIFQL